MENIVYSTDASGLIAKMFFEFSRPAVLAHTTYILDTPLEICVQRITKRNNKDRWGNVGIEKNRMRQYWFYLLAKNLPKLITRIDPTQQVYSKWDRMVVQRAPEKVVEEVWV